MNPFTMLMVELALQEIYAGRYAAAEALVKWAISAWMDVGYCLYLLGHSQYHLKRYAESAIALGDAVVLRPDLASAHNDLSAALHALGRDPEAVAAVQRAVALDPNLAEAEETLGIELLRAGRLREGWPLYEGRLRSTLGAKMRQDHPGPPWRGARPIAGRTIFLHAEQGAGDTLQFVRYARLLAEEGATVVLGVHRGMRTLLTGLAGVSTLIERGEDVPPYDLQCPLLSLPLAFDTDLDSIPADVPYLFAAPERVAAWRARLGPRGKKRVGVVFSGNPAHPDDLRRSIPLVQFARVLAGAPDREFHVLQNELRPADRGVLEMLPNLHEHTAAIADFADTAALIALMDVVVTVDTSVAHLAGAMGWPVWLLLPFKPDWRWMLEREDSPWYPTMWLFRQQRPGDWESVLDEVAKQLDEMLGNP